MHGQDSVKHMYNNITVNTLIIVYSEKKLGDLSQVVKDHCYSRGKIDSSAKVDVCAENDTKTDAKCLDKTSEVTNQTTIVKVAVYYFILFYACIYFLFLVFVFSLRTSFFVVFLYTVEIILCLQRMSGHNVYCNNEFINNCINIDFCSNVKYKW
jgi:hypothetical protein